MACKHIFVARVLHFSAFISIITIIILIIIIIIIIIVHSWSIPFL